MSELEKKIYKYLVNHYFGLMGMHIKPINEAKDLAEIAYNYYMADNSPAKFENTELLKEKTDDKEMNQILADSRLKILGENQELKKQIKDLEVTFNCVNDKNDELNRQLDIMKDIIKTLEHDVRFWKDKSRGLTKPEQRIETIYNKGQCDTCMYSKIKYLDRDEVEKIINKFLKDVITEGAYCEQDIYCNKAITAICSLVVPTKEKIVEILKHYKIEKAVNDILGGYFYEEVKSEQIASEILGDDNEKRKRNLR